MTGKRNSREHLLDTLQRESFEYFLNEVNPANGLVLDRTEPGAPASIAAVGLALSAYPIGVERGFMSSADAVRRTLTTLRFLRDAPQSPAPSATGYKGFYYHFLDLQTGLRAGEYELSTVDTALLLAGMLSAAAYFQQDSEDEQGDPQAGRRTLPARRLEVGAERRSYRHPRMDAGTRLSSVSLGRV
jgi:Uncharacterized protein conserved in bacteria